MKKTIFMAVLVLISGAVLAAPDHLTITLPLPGSPGADFAGKTITANITAYSSTDNSTVDTAFAGPVSVTVSEGVVKVISGQTGERVVISGFSSGIWNGQFVLGAADDLTITAYDMASSAAGVTYKAQTAGDYVGYMVITEGMTHMPGTLAGFSGGAVSLTAGSQFYMTVTAVDNWYNKTTSSATNTLPTIKCRIQSNTTGTYSITPSASAYVDYQTADAYGSTIFAMTISPPETEPPNLRQIEVKDQDSTKSTIVYRYFQKLTDYYMWAEAPELPGSYVMAGVPFPVTVKVSHSPYGNPITGFNQPCSISATVQSGWNGQPLTPDNFSLVDGTGIAMVTYGKRERIKIHPVFNAPAGTYNGYYVTTTANLNYIEVIGNSPAAFTLAADKTKISKSEQAALSVGVTDWTSFANPVSNAAVSFSIADGAGSLSATTALTGADGTVVVLYTPPSENRANIIRASVGTIAPKYITITSSITAIDKNKITNYPNPFRAGKQKTKIDYYLEADSEVTLKLYSVFGNLAWSKTIAKGAAGGREGGNTVEWDGSADAGFTAGAGLYILKVEVKAPSGSYTLTRKIAVIK